MPADPAGIDVEVPVVPASHLHIFVDSTRLFGGLPSTEENGELARLSRIEIRDAEGERARPP